MIFLFRLLYLNPCTFPKTEQHVTAMPTTPRVYFSLCDAEMSSASNPKARKGRRFNSTFRAVASRYGVVLGSSEQICNNCSFFVKIMGMYYVSKITQFFHIILQSSPGQTRGRIVSLSHGRSDTVPDNYQHQASFVNLANEIEIIKDDAHVYQKLVEWGSEVLKFRSTNWRNSKGYVAVIKEKVDVPVRKALVGYGLFVKWKVEKGCMISEYTSSVISKKKNNRREALYKKNGVRDDYMMALSNKKVIDCTTNSTCPARYANRSCSPTSEYREVEDERASVFVFLTATKVTRSLEEVTADYDFTGQDEGVVSDEQVSCQYGAQNCRSFLN